MRPVGALLFGWLAERYGRRPTLMANIVCFSVLELCSAFAPSFRLFLWSRALFGIAMGGEWGVGAALALESLPSENRGFFAGLLQEGYAAGESAGGSGLWRGGNCLSRPGFPAVAVAICVGCFAVVAGGVCADACAGVACLEGP